MSYWKPDEMAIFQLIGSAAVGRMGATIQDAKAGKLDLKEAKAQLFETYQKIAKTGDHKTTASDFLLRELEIEHAQTYISEADNVLDIGCGMGYALRHYASKTHGKCIGLDYSPNMIEMAKGLADDDKKLTTTAASLEFIVGSIENIPLEDESIDIVTSHRCVMALLDWTLQKSALIEIARVLKPGGKLILMEGTQQGLAKLNQLRFSMGLEEIEPEGKDRLFTKKLDEEKLLQFMTQDFNLISRRGFGGYYFISRVIHPLIIAPDVPKYDSPINYVAKKFEEKNPDFIDVGHLQAFTFEKK